jgi:hypothetical protein
MPSQLRETRRNAAQGVAERLLASEQGIDHALTLVASLNGHLPEARISAYLAAEVGHEAIELTSEAFTHLVRARTAMVKAHKSLARVQTDIGLEAFAFGGSYGKPPSAVLQVIAREAA